MIGILGAMESEIRGLVSVMAVESTGSGAGFEHWRGTGVLTEEGGGRSGEKRQRRGGTHSESAQAGPHHTRLPRALQPSARKFDGPIECRMMAFLHGPPEKRGSEMSVVGQGTCEVHELFEAPPQPTAR